MLHPPQKPQMSIYNYQKSSFKFLLYFTFYGLLDVKRNTAEKRDISFPAVLNSESFKHQALHST